MHLLLLAAQLLCTPTPTTQLLPAVIGAARGADPIWVVDSGSGGDGRPIKTMWVFHTADRVRIEGREVATGKRTRFQIGGANGPITDDLVLDDPRRVSVRPGGASADIMKEYAFLPSYVFYPQPGCYEFTIELPRATQKIVVEVH